MVKKIYMRLGLAREQIGAAPNKKKKSRLIRKLYKKCMI